MPTWVPKYHTSFVEPIVNNLLAYIRSNFVDALTWAYGGSIAAVAATGSWVIASAPADGDTITANGALFTFRSSPVGDYEIQIGASAAITVTSAAAKLNASVDPLVAVATYSAVTTTLGVTHDTAGRAGNAYTLAESSSAISASGTTLLGGLDAIANWAAIYDSRIGYFQETLPDLMVDRISSKLIEKADDGGVEQLHQIYLIFELYGTDATELSTRQRRYMRALDSVCRKCPKTTLTVGVTGTDVLSHEYGVLHPWHEGYVKQGQLVFAVTMEEDRNNAAV